MVYAMLHGRDYFRLGWYKYWLRCVAPGLSESVNMSQTSCARRARSDKPISSVSLRDRNTSRCRACRACRVSRAPPCATRSACTLRRATTLARCCSARCAAAARWREPWRTRGRRSTCLWTRRYPDKFNELCVRSSWTLTVEYQLL